MTLGDLLKALGGQPIGATARAAHIQAMATRLAETELGIEPDVLAGAAARRYDESIVVFAGEDGDVAARNRADYRAAQLMLQLASAVAAVDGDFGPKEMLHLSQQIKTWSHLSPAQQQRLLAHLRLLVTQPATLSGLKKKVEPLSASARESIAEFMVAVAHADGMIEASEVKMLERAYRALGIDAGRVFNDLHVTAAAPKTPRPGVVPGSDSGAPESVARFQLDQEKVARLQKDTAKVALLLSSIFAEEQQQVTEAVEVAIEDAESDVDDELEVGLLALDGQHTAFANMLLQRESWSRSEAADVAADLGLMLDGALERVNEAAFEHHDMPLVEGDDPLEVNREIREVLDA
jgi:tellurite resistance protein